MQHKDDNDSNHPNHSTIWLRNLVVRTRPTKKKRRSAKNANPTSQGNHRMYENHFHRCTHGRSKRNPGSGSAKPQTTTIRRQDCKPAKRSHDKTNATAGQYKKPRRHIGPRIQTTQNTKKTNEPRTLPKQTPLWNNRSQNRSRTHLQNKPHNKRKSHNTRQRNRNNKRDTSQYDSWKHIHRWIPIGNGQSGMRSSLTNKQWNMEKNTNTT
jgi:hypothetical protein